MIVDKRDQVISYENAVLQFEASILHLKDAQSAMAAAAIVSAEVTNLREVSVKLMEGNRIILDATKDVFRLVQEARKRLPNRTVFITWMKEWLDRP